MINEHLDIEENLEATYENYSELTENILRKLEWFQDQKIGVIFHWGIDTNTSIVKSWQLSKEDDWARKRGGWRNGIDKLREDYWNLHYQFNPHKFDAAD